jgi:hypothetical protein
MTEWHTPGEEPEAGPDEPSSIPRGGNRRQTQLLALAALIIVTAIVLAVVVVLRSGSDGPAKGSPEAVGDDFATALRSGSTARVEALACPPAKAEVLRAVQTLLGPTTSAGRKGSATVRGDVAVLRLGLTVAGHDRIGTLALNHASGQWCAQVFAATPP